MLLCIVGGVSYDPSQVEVVDGLFKPSFSKYHDVGVRISAYELG